MDSPCCLRGKNPVTQGTGHRNFKVHCWFIALENIGGLRSWGRMPGCQASNLARMAKEFLVFIEGIALVIERSNRM